MTIPAPPPYGVSSTWPPDNGVPWRKSTSSICAPVLRTWRCSTNQSNQCGNSVKTSICISEPEEVAVDLDDLLFEVDALHSVADQRHEMLLEADLEQRARRGVQHPLDVAEPRYLAADQVCDQVLVLLELVVHEQQLAAHRRRVRDAVQLDQRPIVGTGPPDDLTGLTGDLNRRPKLEVRPGLLDVEAPVQAVWLAHAPGGDLCQSTRSTSRRWSCDAPTARITVRSAEIVRPRRPITWPTSSCATCSSSTIASSSSIVSK